jgi:glucosamine-phosphate N-acetyltransferase
MRFIIRELRGPDLSNGILETLCNLADVQLTPERAGELHRRRLRAGVRCYVAWSTESEAVIGTVSLLIEQKFIHRGGLVGHIEDVSVRVGYEKMGIGTALVQHAKEQARKIGCYKVILDCAEHLVPFYASLGFHRNAVQMRIDLYDSSEHLSDAQSRSRRRESESGERNHDPATDHGAIAPLASVG